MLSGERAHAPTLIAQGTLGKQNKPGSVNRVHHPFAPQEKTRMLKEPTQTLDGPALSEEVYHFALERIKALMGARRIRPKRAS